MEPEISKAVIFDYFSGRTTAFQKQQIEIWAADPQNRELFFKWLWEWERRNNQYPADPEEGLRRHWKRMDEASAPENVSRGKRRQPVSFLAGWRKGLVAATLLLAVCAGGWFFKDPILFRTYSTAYGEIRKIVLTDSSRVMLNANSVLKVPRFGFGPRSREVYLKGEAGFDIMPLPDKKRFVVKTDSKLDVVVLGTSFNVYARPRGTRVVLSEGKVQLKYRQGIGTRQWTMHPGDLAVLQENGEVDVRKTEEPALHSAWKFHRFVFDETSLLEISQQLEERFGVKVIISGPHLAALTISGAFTALEAEDLLQLLCDASGRLDYRKLNDNSIVLSDR